MIVFGVVPGTGRRIRQTVHRGLAFDAALQHVTIRADTTPSFEDGALVVRDEGNVKFDPWKFTRGLHRVALGVMARQMGAEAVLPPQYDAVRSYIRKPRGRAEFWPYFQRPSDRLLGNRSFPPALAAQGFKLAFFVADPATYVYMNLFVSEFVVALHGATSALNDEVLGRMAIAADTPTPLSTRRWLCHDSAQPGPEIRLTPADFPR